MVKPDPPGAPARLMASFADRLHNPPVPAAEEVIATLSPIILPISTAGTYSGLSFSETALPNTAIIFFKKLAPAVYPRFIGGHKFMF